MNRHSEGSIGRRSRTRRARPEGAGGGTTEERGRDVAVLLFAGVEVLDFAGPFEVFSVAGHLQGRTPFNVFTVAESGRPVVARNGLRVIPRYRLRDCPPASILVVPGGYGTRRELHNPRMIDWIRARAGEVEMVLSVCTGSLLLAKAGLLEGLAATTHHGAFDLLEQLAPGARLERSERVVDNGRIVLSGGISAGIDMSLHVVAKLHGAEMARTTAQYMEYRFTAPPPP